MNTQFVDNLNVIKKHYKLPLVKMSEVFGYGGDTTQDNYIKGNSAPSYQYLMKVSEYVGISLDRLCYEEIKTTDLPERPNKSGLRITVYEPTKNIEVSEPLASYVKAKVLATKPLLDSEGLEMVLSDLIGRVERLEKEKEK